MPRETTLKGRLGDLQRLKAMLNANSADLQHLEAMRARFEALLAQAEQAADQQAVHTASKQEATKQLQSFISEGERLGNVLRLGVKQHYGIRSEKLAEFKMQPFRGRPRRNRPTPTEPPVEEPSATRAEDRPPASAEPRP